jgi:hypothetical protein
LYKVYNTTKYEQPILFKNNSLPPINQSDSNFNVNLSIENSDYLKQTTLDAGDEKKAFLLYLMGSILIIILLLVFTTYCIFSRCLKQRYVDSGDETKKRWMCRKATKKFMCFSKLPRSCDQARRAEKKASYQNEQSMSPIIELVTKIQVQG